MKKPEQADNLRQEQSTRHYDLSEEGSKRPEGEADTVAARHSEGDDINADSGTGGVDTGSDFFGENTLSTSLDDE